MVEYLSDVFLSPFVGVRPKNAGPLFEVTVLGKYSRWLKDKKRRETWLEVCKRTVEHSLSLYQGPASHDKLVAEAELMFNYMFNLLALPAGRSMRIGGTAASLAYPESNFNCFSRDTKFLTSEGIKSFEDFEDGQVAKVLNKSASWVDATVKKFGMAKLYKLTLARGKTKQEIFTTDNHRWVVREYPYDYHSEIKQTTSLEKGDLIPIIRANRTVKINPCAVGIQHGIVYGDGTYNKQTGRCRIDLQDESKELASLFHTGTVINQGAKGGKVNERAILINNLPYNWKQLPNLAEANKEYVLGFLMGWFASDGCVSGTPCLTNKSKEVLEWAKSAFSLLGIYTGDVLTQRTHSPFDGSEKPLYRINIFKEFINKEFFIRTRHINGFTKQPTNDLGHWIVESVEETDRVEEVWCVVEPNTESFTLACGALTKNCCFTIVDKLEDFCEIFHLTMCSCGVGLRCLKSDAAKLPLLNTDITIKHDKHNSLYPFIKEEETKLEYLGWQGSKENYIITVGDSKSGWVDALRKFLSIVEHNHNPIEIKFNYDYVRKSGDRLETWGGLAAGPEGLVKMFDNLADLIRNSNGKLRPIDVLDVATYIAKNVVVGGTRRAALIFLFSSDDMESRSAKRILGYFGYTDTGEPAEYEDYTEIKYDVEVSGKIKWFSNPQYEHRTMSNNSIIFESRPSFEELKNIFKSIRHNGEPGFFNLEAAKRRRPNVEGLNPCAEILLAPKGVCNLSTVVMPNHIINNNTINWDSLEKAVRLATRIGLRQTNVTLSLPEWDAVQKRDRLVGPSKTGEMDFLDRLGIESDSNEHKRVLEFMNWIANEEADLYSFEMRIPRPLLVTSVKPEGTLSLLSTVSPGMHRAFAPYYIRRFKFADFDPMCKALIELGVSHEKDITKEDSNRIVFSFPIKSNATTKASDESFRDQFFRYLTEQKYYTDHNTSCTLYVGKDEWEEAVQLVFDHWDDVIAVSFLPKDEGVYPQAPFQACSEAEFLSTPMPDMTLLNDLVSKYELEEFNESTMDEQEVCSSGACPPV